MHWLYFYETNILEFSNLNKLQWTSLTLHSSSPFNPCLAHCCSLLLATESPYFPGPFPFWVLLLADSWFSTCFSQCGHFLRMRSRLFFYRPLYSLIVGQPICIHGFHCPLYPSDPRSMCPEVLHPWFAMSVHHDGLSQRWRTPGKDPKPGWLRHETGSSSPLDVCMFSNPRVQLPVGKD